MQNSYFFWMLGPNLFSNSLADCFFACLVHIGFGLVSHFEFWSSGQNFFSPIQYSIFHLFFIFYIFTYRCHCFFLVIIYFIYLLLSMVICLRSSKKKKKFLFRQGWWWVAEDRGRKNSCACVWAIVELENVAQIQNDSRFKIQWFTTSYIWIFIPFSILLSLWMTGNFIFFFR